MDALTDLVAHAQPACPTRTSAARRQSRGRRARTGGAGRRATPSTTCTSPAATSTRRGANAWRCRTSCAPRCCSACAISSAPALLPVFHAAGVTPLRQVGEALGMKPDELAAIWAHLPWDDRAIGRRLGITGLQVLNLRTAARSRLLRGAGAQGPTVMTTTEHLSLVASPRLRPRRAAPVDAGHDRRPPRELRRLPGGAGPRIRRVVWSRGVRPGAGHARRPARESAPHLRTLARRRGRHARRGRRRMGRGAHRPVHHVRRGAARPPAVLGFVPIKIAMPAEPAPGAGRAAGAGRRAGRPGRERRPEGRGRLGPPPAYGAAPPSAPAALGAGGRRRVAAAARCRCGPVDRDDGSIRRSSLLASQPLAAGRASVTPQREVR